MNFKLKMGDIAIPPPPPPPPHPPPLQNTLVMKIKGYGHQVSSDLFGLDTRLTKDNFNHVNFMTLLVDGLLFQSFILMCRILWFGLEAFIKNGQESKRIGLLEILLVVVCLHAQCGGL